MEISIKKWKKKQIVAVVGMAVRLSNGDFYENSNKKQTESVIGMTVGLSDGDFYEKVKEKKLWL